jgi:hypothetical protein
MNRFESLGDRSGGWAPPGAPNGENGCGFAALGPFVVKTNTSD